MDFYCFLLINVNTMLILLEAFGDYFGANKAMLY